LNGSLLRLFSVGVTLLLAPVLIAIWQADVCAVRSVYCFVPIYGKMIDSILPYVMLGGGLFVGYGMKKLADTQREILDDENKSQGEMGLE
jgi:hypothetical protein